VAAAHLHHHLFYSARPAAPTPKLHARLRRHHLGTTSPVLPLCLYGHLRQRRSQPYRRHLRDDDHRRPGASNGPVDAVCDETRNTHENTAPRNTERPSLGLPSRALNVSAVRRRIAGSTPTRQPHRKRRRRPPRSSELRRPTGAWRERLAGAMHAEFGHLEQDRLLRRCASRTMSAGAARDAVFTHVCGRAA